MRLLMLLFLILLVGCTSQPMGTLVIEVNSEAKGIALLYVAFSEIELRKVGETDEWIKISDKPNLISFVSSNESQTILQTELTPAMYSHIRLKLDSATAVIGDRNVLLEIPKGGLQYIILNKPFEIKKGETTLITLAPFKNMSYIEADDRSVLLGCGVSPTVYRLTPIFPNTTIK